MSMNGKRCAIKQNLNGDNGAQLCGSSGKEQVFRVRGCSVTLPAVRENMPLTVRIWTSLDGESHDESFGVDNVIISKLEEKGYSENIHHRE